MANAKIIEEKKAAVSALVEKLNKANAVVLVDYRGINVADDTALRKELREANVEYKVIKNNIMRHACENVGMHDLVEDLVGTVAVAISEDEIAPCRVLNKYASQYTDKFNIKAGFIDGQKVDLAMIRNLAKLPGREGLIAQVAGSFNSIIASLARGLDAVREQKESA
ncbi:MAG: 50S ribosomal protein L10 [Oscillospiraceae bacterium]|nr:50S ribosomal protein L10 [Oscillospiraceae bacterium]